MSRKNPPVDPWVQYAILVNENVGCEDNSKLKWNNRWPDPVKARNATFERVGCQQSQEGSPYSNFRSETGVIRPGVDPLPHHYKIEQNWKVIRPHVADHERVFANGTKPRRRFDPKHEPLYMSIADITDKDEDFRLRAAKLLESPQGRPRSSISGSLHVRELVGAKERLLAEIAKVDHEIGSLPASRATGSHRKGDAVLPPSRLANGSRPRSMLEGSAFQTRAPFATPTRTPSRRHVKALLKGE